MYRDVCPHIYIKYCIRLCVSVHANRGQSKLCFFGLFAFVLIMKIAKGIHAYKYMLVFICEKKYALKPS